MSTMRTYIRLGAALFPLLPCLAQAEEVVTSAPHAALQAERVGTFWTATRKASAKPMELRGVAGAPVAASAAATRTARSPGSVAGNLPADAKGSAGHAGAVGPVQTQAEMAPAFGADSTVWYPYPPPSTLSIPVLDYVVRPLYPNTALGKLYFSDGSSNYVCSAQSVTSAGNWGAGNRQTVVTAGHCCSDGAGTFFSNWLFEPAHRNGAAPLGSWAGYSATVFTAWHTGGDLSRDTCMLQMQTLNGQNINDAVGALGYAYDQPLPQSYYATGWPQGAPFTGGLLYYSTASNAETDTSQAGSLPFTHGIGNSMTGGSSGGGWILKYQSLVASANTNLFNGLNSYKYTLPNRPAEMFGPYIDNVFVNSLLQAVATAPPAP